MSDSLLATLLALATLSLFIGFWEALSVLLLPAFPFILAALTAIDGIRVYLETSGWTALWKSAQDTVYHHPPLSHAQRRELEAAQRFFLAVFGMNGIPLWIARWRFRVSLLLPVAPLGFALFSLGKLAAAWLFGLFIVVAVLVALLFWIQFYQLNKSGKFAVRKAAWLEKIADEFGGTKHLGDAIYRDFGEIPHPPVFAKVLNRSGVLLSSLVLAGAILLRILWQYVLGDPAAPDWFHAIAIADIAGCWLIIFPAWTSSREWGGLAVGKRYYPLYWLASALLAGNAPPATGRMWRASWRRDIRQIFLGVPNGESTGSGKV